MGCPMFPVSLSFFDFDPLLENLLCQLFFLCFLSVCVFMFPAVLSI